ncbi:N-acetylneuraminate lyase isoform X2 [Protopterus annectens]|uniref:N-acetylneuraminate lyase isoform X2 n=1 Tax=Protopterus annectens TaxID=7888 RepID=UPI001CFB204C|nr:N-acetylneuraminate lyase isoform X2 [Protopterus annectens]
MASHSNSLTGLVAATFTPFDKDGEVNLSVIGDYVDYLVKKQEVRSVFVNGTSGEGLSLSVEERKQLAAEWVKQGKNKLDHVIIHVGSMSLKESQELAAHAAEIKADGIAVISPFFLKPRSSEGLVLFIQKIASAAPALPLYYYHIPELTGVKVLAEDVLDEIMGKVPTFQGLKYSSSDLLDFGRCVNKYKNSLSLLYGKDEELLGGLVLGASGAIGSTYNYLGWWNNKMLDSFHQSKYEEAKNQQALEYLKTSLSCHGILAFRWVPHGSL